jgi:hypothetical protein
MLPRTALECHMTEGILRFHQQQRIIYKGAKIVLRELPLLGVAQTAG